MDGKSAAGSWRHDVVALLLLLLAAGGVRLYLFYHTEVAARDSISFIRLAWQLGHENWTEALKKADQHPGYPLLVLAMSQPVRHYVPEPESLTMQLAAQLVSVVAGTLLVIPMFYLGKELFNRTAGFWASVLFQCLPASCRVLSDGLSEATFLLFAVTALYLAARALRGQSALLFALCGLFSGLAFLTRREGALIVPVTGLVLLGMQGLRTWRRPWRRFLVCGASLAVAALLVGGPLVAVTGRISKATEPGVLWKVAQVNAEPPVALAMVGPAVWWHDWALTKDQPTNRTWWGFRAVGYEIIKSYHYVVWVPALLGLWWSRDRLRQSPGAWALLLLCATIVLLLWRVAAVMGYVSDRHTLLILICGCYAAVAAIASIGQWLAVLLQSRRPVAHLHLALKTAGRLVMVLLLLGLVGSALPKALEPLHVNRGGFRAVGVWLAGQVQPGDAVLDPYTWTSYYAGQEFHTSDGNYVPGHPPRPRYVILEESNNPHPHLPQLARAKAWAAQGKEVHRWTGHHGKERAEIVVYEVPRS
jgi:hypothetical protein